MENKAPSTRAKHIDAHVERILRQVDLSKLSSKERNIIMKLKQELSDAKIYARDYELSETLEEQIENAGRAKKDLEKARKNILHASEYDLFGPIDVAHLTAEIEQAMTDLSRSR